jgi:hypothetical protein
MADKPEVLIEIRRIGAFAKVSEVDPVTLTEVAVTGPASASDADLTRLAVARLRRKLGKA